MTETKCEWCPRDISKHDPLALKICLLKAIREKLATKPSEAIEEIEDIESNSATNESK